MKTGARTQEHELMQNAGVGGFQYWRRVHKERLWCRIQQLPPPVTGTRAHTEAARDAEPDADTEPTLAKILGVASLAPKQTTVQTPAHIQYTLAQIQYTLSQIQYTQAQIQYTLAQMTVGTISTEILKRHRHTLVPRPAIEVDVAGIDQSWVKQST